MAIAAVPAYLGNDFSTASPAMRFGYYLTLWGENRRTHQRLWGTHDLDYEVRGRDRQEREVKKENKVEALQAATRLTEADRQRLEALIQRQNGLAATLPAANHCVLDAESVAPFTTGLGNEHPLENGFAFLNPYGLPYLPGSGIKGVIRQAARELASGEWGESHGWSTLPRYTLGRGRTAVAVSVIDLLLGRESQEGDTDHLRGVITFWDAIPQIAGDHLKVEMMTPHQSHYYQQKPAAGSTAPHESGQPNPISFLTVPARSQWVFHLVCDSERLRRLAPDLESQWQPLLRAAFGHAFQWLGFGAKTAVGYGAMRPDEKAETARQQQAKEQRQQAEQRAEKQRQAAERAAQRAQMSPVEAEMADRLAARSDQQSAKSVSMLQWLEQNIWTGEARREAARLVKQQMVEEKRWKERSEKKNPDKDKEYQATQRVLKFLD